ncbi:MAG: SIS domain-containing protein [Planktomarina sp.]|nr:SIS domain-containing protein [Planktomarina sp.]
MPQKSAVEPAATVLNVIRCFTLGFAQMETALVSPEMQKIVSQACGLIFEMEGRLILTGVGKSGHMARKLAATFASTGTPAYFMHAAEASHGDLGMIQSSDVLLLLSWSGETRELSDSISYALRFDVPMIAITGGAESTLARKAQYSLVLPQAKEACPHNLAPTTSTLLQVAMGDALAITLLRMRGFSEESFRDFHPGGKLGAVLQPISDIMHESKQLPLL